MAAAAGGSRRGGRRGQGQPHLHRATVPAGVQRSRATRKRARAPVTTGRNLQQLIEKFLLVSHFNTNLFHILRLFFDIAPA